MYRGAAFNDPIYGMFSSFLCQAYEDSREFARPTIQMPTITDSLVRGVKITKCKNFDEACSQWKEIVKQVTRTCCLVYSQKCRQDVNLHEARACLQCIMWYNRVACTGLAAKRKEPCSNRLFNSIKLEAVPQRVNRMVILLHVLFVF